MKTYRINSSLVDRILCGLGSESDAQTDDGLSVSGRRADDDKSSTTRAQASDKHDEYCSVLLLLLCGVFMWWMLLRVNEYLTFDISRVALYRKFIIACIIIFP